MAKFFFLFFFVFYMLLTFVNVYKKNDCKRIHQPIIMWQLIGFTRSVTLLIETNPHLTSIAKLELYAAINTLTHNIVMHNREQDLKRAAILNPPCVDCPTRRKNKPNL